AAWLKTVKDARDTDAKTNPVLRAIRAQVLAVYGEDQNVANILAEFGCGFRPSCSPRSPHRDRADRRS
ncbi:MAG TPA: hypothetical protein VMI75_07375, partial [Polyangiaceae bacterium]|nr:hypothetical protein [Polyangiaceae bacterium]